MAAQTSHFQHTREFSELKRAMWNKNCRGAELSRAEMERDALNVSRMSASCHLKDIMNELTLAFLFVVNIFFKPTRKLLCVIIDLPSETNLFVV